MSKTKFQEFVKYLESSQGAGQLITQLNLQVLSLKPANKDSFYNGFQTTKCVYIQYILPLAQVPTGKDKLVL